MRMTGGKRKSPLREQRTFPTKPKLSYTNSLNSKYNKASAYIQYKNMKTEEKYKWKKTRQN